MSRPSTYTVAIGQEICARLSQGEPLTWICRDDDKPCDDTVRAWAKLDEAFGRDIARAREAGYDAIAHRLRETARGKGESTRDVQRDKLIIETDLKLLAKWDKRYADRVVHAGDQDNPVEVRSIVRKVVDPTQNVS